MKFYLPFILQNELISVSLIDSVNSFAQILKSPCSG